MKREIIKDLIQWKDSKERKPLIIVGARQVGKTWLMKEFGKTEFKNYAYIMFERNKNMEELFNGSLKPKDLIPFLQAEAGVTIEPNNTLIIFDEVQAVPNALTSLKFFYEEAPEYAIVAGGSTLGITLHKGDSYPVGKTDMLHMYPMTFKEFLIAIGEDLLVGTLENEDLEKSKIFHEKLERYLRQYFYIGGMPEVVKSWVQGQSYKDVRKIQKRLLNDYEQDFSKYATPLIATKLRMLWRSIPNQISKENKKFIYGAVKEGARARDFETAIEWLIDCSLINKVLRVSAIREPLKSYEDFGAFKLYLHDIGLLGAMVNVKEKAIVENTKLYTEFKGSLSEQFVSQELSINNIPIFYWSSEDNRQEIDFLIENDDGIIPIEVKSGENLTSVSFNNFISNNKSPYGIKLSVLPYVKNEKVINMPLYLANKIK